MAYKITDECISCGACDSECKNEAISEAESIYVIDPDKCTECIGCSESSKSVEISRVDSCVLHPAYQETREQLLEKWRKLHPGETPTVT